MRIIITFVLYIIDVTALCILEGFQNPKSLMTADRVLKQLGQSKAKETYAVSFIQLGQSKAKGEP